MEHIKEDDYAKHKCLRCSYRWESIPGPTQCPICGHLYVKWINYEEMRKKWNEERKQSGKTPI